MFLMNWYIPIGKHFSDVSVVEIIISHFRVIVGHVNQGEQFDSLKVISFISCKRMFLFR